MNYSLQAWSGKTLLMCGAAAVTLVASGGIAQAQSADSKAAVSGVEDILVTARRKEERNQDVPVAITAFGNERLQEMNIVSTQNLQSSVPSLVVGANGQGQRDVESPTIRGQGATFQASPGVAVYMAEAPLPGALTISSQGGPGNYLDLQNVQVLKGPQGTLFGRNTTGGAVLLSPQKPTDRMEGYVQLQGGNFNDREVQAVVNIPVIEDKLLVRFAGEIVDRDGYTKDINWNKDRDDKHYWTGRLGVTWRPTDKIENYLMGYNTQSRSNGTGIVHRGFNLAAYGPAGYGICDTTVPGVPALAAPCSLYQDLTDAQTARGERTVAHSADDYLKVETWGVTDILDLQLSDSLTFRNIANYSKLKVYYSYDSDGTIAGGSDINPFTQRSIPRDDLQQYSEEAQFQGNALGGRLSYVAGAFYFKSEPDGLQGYGSVNVCPIGFGAFCTTYAGAGDGATSPFNARAVYGVTNESKALYAQGTYDLGGVVKALDGLRLTLGYRYTWDKVDGFASLFGAAPGGGFVCSNSSALVADPAACEFSSTLESERPTWTAGLDYKLRPDLLVYGKISRGYKAGGFNTYAVRPTTRTFGPEEVTSYEVGFKSDFTVQDMPVRLNAGVFLTEYEKIQRATGDFNAATLASGAQILSTASAKIRGIEIETVVKPTTYLELGANYSYIDAEYDSFDYTVSSPFGHEDCSGAVIPFGGTANLSCLPLQYIAPNIANVYARLNIRDNLSLFVNYAWTDDQHTEALQLEKNQPGERLESYGLLNATLDWKGISGSNIDLAVFATNLTDETYRISNTDIYQAGSVGTWGTIYGEPRMVGARLRYNWGG